MSHNLPLEEIIRLIEEQKKLSREEIHRLVQQKIQNLGGFLTEQGAAHIVARELGVDLSGSTHFEPIQIIDLNPMMNNVSIKGRITRISSVREFQRKDGGIGALRRIELVDETGSITLVLWDHATAYVEEQGLQVGDVVKVVGAYTKPGRNTAVELHIGNRGKIEKMEEDESIPKVSKEITPIKHITGDTSEVSIKGKIANVYPASTFTRSDGSEGKVASLILKDEDSTIRVVFWGSEAETIQALSPGTCVEILNLRPRQQEGRDLELHSGQYTVIRKLPDKECQNIEIPEKQFETNEVKIKDLQPGMKNISLIAVVVGKESPRTIQRKDGSEGKVATLYIKDDSGSTRLTLWDEKAEESNSIEPGSTIKISNATAREGYGTDQPELSLGRYGTLETINSETSAVTELSTPIDSLSENSTSIVIQGKVLRKDPLREFTRKDGSQGKLQALIVSDSTGQVRIIAWDNNAQKLSEAQEGLGYEFGNLSSKTTEQGIELLFGRGSYLKPIELENIDDILMTADTLINRPYPMGTEEPREIATVQDGEFVTIEGTIVKIFEPVIYSACPECNKKITADNMCETHGLVQEASKRGILSLVVDDATETLHCTFFGDQVERVLGLSIEDLEALKEEHSPEAIQAFLDEKLLLSEIRITGKVRLREEMKRLEINVSRFVFLNPKDEVEKTLSKLGTPPK